MSNSIKHRGPDGDGFLFSGNTDKGKIEFIKTSGDSKRFVHTIPSERQAFFAHRRLSIIDLSDIAFQPMSDDSEKIWIIFNGEIYNHAEIRTELEQDGYAFKTNHSDTEMIIYAYKKWGIECIHKFRGMFAICLWDIEKDLFYLVRDRIGIKPLYYTVSEGVLYFASEIKAILQNPSVKRELNEKGFYNYLQFLTVPAPNTLFKNIYKLQPGHYIEIKNGQMSAPIEYWDVFDEQSNLSNKSEAEIQEEVIRLLKTSVKYRLESDVPVGVFLSGGIDSSLNTALFSEIAKEPVRAFSIGYENDSSLKSYKNEFIYARKVAEMYGCKYTEQELTQKNLMDFLPEMIHYQDEPIGDPVCVPLYYVSKLARDNGVTVCQVGEGSDELFGGYHYWKQSLEMERYSSIPFTKPIKYLAQKIMGWAGQKNTVLYELVRRSHHERNQIFWGSVTSFGEEEKQALLGSAIKEQLKDYSTWEEIEPYYKRYTERSPEKAPLNWMSYFDLKLRIPELLLMRVDKMSMAVALEARVPFLDHKFVAYSMSIPAALKIKNREPKYLLKKAVEKILPYDVIYRKKQGFGAPVYDWFLDELGVMAKTEIDVFIEKTNLLNKVMIDSYFEKKEGTKIWYILNFVLWYKQYIGYKNA